MNIRHKVNKSRQIMDVEIAKSGTAYMRIVDDMQELYPMRFWEPLDIESWELVTPVETPDQRGLLVDGAHVATVIDRDHRFVVHPYGVEIERRR